MPSSTRVERLKLSLSIVVMISPSLVERLKVSPSIVVMMMRYTHTHTHTHYLPSILQSGYLAKYPMLCLSMLYMELSSLFPKALEANIGPSYIPHTLCFVTTYVVCLLLSFHDQHNMLCILNVRFYVRSTLYSTLAHYVQQFIHNSCSAIQEVVMIIHINPNIRCIYALNFRSMVIPFLGHKPGLTTSKQVILPTNKLLDALQWIIHKTQCATSCYTCSCEPDC